MPGHYIGLDFPRQNDEGEWYVEAFSTEQSKYLCHGSIQGGKWLPRIEGISSIVTQKFLATWNTEYDAHQEAIKYYQYHNASSYPYIDAYELCVAQLGKNNLNIKSQVMEFI